jgi:hypothetical protein
LSWRKKISNSVLSQLRRNYFPRGTVLYTKYGTLDATKWHPLFLRLCPFLNSNLLMDF